MTPYDAARAAAEQAGVELAELQELESLEAASRLFSVVWDTPHDPPAPTQPDGEVPLAADDADLADLSTPVSDEEEQ